MGEKASEETVVQAPSGAVMALITDFERYPDWADAIQEVKVLERDADGQATRVYFRVDARVLEVEYTLDYRIEANRMSWSLVSSDQFNQLDGSYDLEPDGDDRTIVRYELEVGLKIPVPSFLRKRAAKAILETSLGELKRQAEART